MRRWPILTLALAAATAASLTGLVSAQAAAQAAQPGWRIWQVTGGTSPAGPGNIYSGIVALGKNDAWVAGATSGNAKQPPRLTVKHWTGKSWQQLSLGAASSAGGGTIAASSPANALVVVGGFAGSNLLRWGGKSWTVSHITGATLVNGETLSATNAWAFGVTSHSLTGYATHYNGHSWAKTSVPVLADQTGEVSAVSAGDIWAVGVPAANPYTGKVETAYYNGRSWKTIPITNLRLSANESLYNPAIVALSPGNVWVYSWLQGFEPHAGVVPLTQVVLTHWNGKTWSRVTVPYATSQSGYIAADGHGGVWLSALGAKNVSYLYHYNGGKWTRTATPTVKGYSTYVSALASIPGTTSVWAVGELLSNADNQNSKAVIWKYGA